MRKVRLVSSSKRLCTVTLFTSGHYMGARKQLGGWTKLEDVGRFACVRRWWKE